MKGLFDFCGACLKKNSEEELRPQRSKNNKKNKNRPIKDLQSEMNHLNGLHYSYDLLGQSAEQQERQKQAMMTQQNLLQKLEKKRLDEEKLERERLEQIRLEEERIKQEQEKLEKERLEKIRQQRILNDLKIKDDLRIPITCLYEVYQPKDGEVVIEQGHTVQKKILEDQQFKLQTIIELETDQPQQYTDLFEAINTIQQAIDMNMWNIQKIEKCNFYSIYNEDQPTYYLATVTLSTIGDLQYIDEDNISGLNFKNYIKKNKKPKYQAYKELFEDLSKLHSNNLVMQTIEPKNLDYNLLSNMDNEQNAQSFTKLYFQNILNFEEEMNLNIFAPKKNYFTHPAYLTYRRNEINRAQDIYAVCLTALVVDAYSSYDDINTTTNTFFEKIEYFKDYDQQTTFPEKFSNSKKIKQLKEYGQQQSNNLLQEISKFYKIQIDSLHNEESSEEEQTDLNNQMLELPNGTQNVDKNFELDVSKITEKDQESGSLEEENKMLPKLKKICGKSFHCYMFLGLNFDVEQIPSAQLYVKILDHLLQQEESSEESSQDQIQIQIDESKNQLSNNIQSVRSQNSSEEVPVIEIKNIETTSDLQNQTSHNKIVV